MSRLSVILVLFLVGCSNMSTSSWVQPIYISKDDRLTEGTAKQIAVHNETWEKNQ